MIKNRLFLVNSPRLDRIDNAARAIFLYTLLIDSNGTLGDAYADLAVELVSYLSVEITKEMMITICKHSAKLARASRTIDAWKQSGYNDILCMMNSDTLQALNRCWTQYAAASADPIQHTWVTDLADDAKYHHANTTGNHDIINLNRSFGALALQCAETAKRMEDCMWCRIRHYLHEGWFVNPLLAYSSSSGKHFALHPLSNPFSGLHCGFSLINLDSGSSFHEVLATKFSNDQKAIKSILIVFIIWCIDFIGFVRNSRVQSSKAKLRMRFFVGDPCALCFALDKTSIQSYNALSSYAQPMSGKPVKLDNYCGEGPNSPPSSFNVVETSDLVDTIGLLNILICVIPLLQYSPATTLFTDTLFFPTAGKTTTSLLSKTLGENVGGICSLLGVAPITYLTGVDTHGNADLPVSPQHGSFHRIAWKFSILGDTKAQFSQSKVICDPKELSELFHSIYSQMFIYDNGEFCAEINNRAEATGKVRFHPPQYTRQSFTAFLAFIKPRVLVHWDSTMSLFMDRFEVLEATKIETHVDELSLYLYLFGVYTTPKLRLENHSFNTVTRGIRLTFTIPNISCLVLTIPRRVIQPLHAKCLEKKGRLNLIFQAWFHRNGSSTANAPRFSVTPIFGKLTPQSNSTYIIQEDLDGWEGTSDLHLYTYVPTCFVRECACSPQDLWMHIQIMVEGSTMMLLEKADFNIFNSKISDTEFVHLTKSFSGMAAPTPKNVSSPPESLAASNETIRVTHPRISLAHGTFTTRITFVRDVEKKQLSTGVAVSFKDVSPCTITIALGDFTHQSQFPFPIAKPRLRINRKSAWIEIIVSLSSPIIRGGYFSFPFPVVSDTPGVLIPWTFPTVDLSSRILPKVELRQSKSKEWLIGHLDRMFPGRDTQLTFANSGSQSILKFKRTLFYIFERICNTQDRVFELTATSTSIPFLVFYVSALYLDDSTDNVVAEAFAIVVDQPTKVGKSIASKAVKLSLGEEDARLWKVALPAMAERCRKGVHDVGCLYSVEGAMRHDGVKEICNCGLGECPDELTKHPMWRHFKQFTTRIAISPIFDPPYVENAAPAPNNSANDKEIQVESEDKKEQVTKCSGNGCTETGTKQCSACLQVSYCSKSCQREDWKRHRNLCQQVRGALNSPQKP